MELLISLIALLSDHEKEILRKRYSGSANLHEKLLLLLLSSTSSKKEKELIAALKTTANTFHKTCTLSKDLLIEHIAKQTGTDFDEIFIVKELANRMDTSSALKYYNHLEKEFESIQNWQALELLYIEGFRLSHITGDISGAKQVAKKRNENALRLHKFINLSSAINVNMLTLEGFATRKPTADYLKSLVALHKQSEQLEHAALIHNTLNLLFHYYSRYTDLPSKVAEIAEKIKANAERNKTRLSGTRYYLAMNTYLVFLTIYSNYGDPKQYAEQLRKKIKTEGNIALANLCYAMLEYCLHTFNKKETEFWLNELDKADDRSKFSQYRFGILAMKSFVEKDLKGFKTNLQLFYADPSYSGFPDMETMLRILELLMMLQEKAFYLMETKLNSLRVYMDRNLDKNRYAQERIIMQAIASFVKNQSKDKMQKAMLPLQKTTYRNVRFLVEILKGIVGK